MGHLYHGYVSHNQVVYSLAPPLPLEQLELHRHLLGGFFLDSHRLRSSEDLLGATS